MKIKRKAWNRGTAAYLGGNRVLWVWACGCTKEEEIKNISLSILPKMVEHWRLNGVSLEQCGKHPEYYNKRSQVTALNLKYPSK